MSEIDFRPMLACREVPDDQLRFPIYGSPKLDGIRALGFGHSLLSRKLKDIPNHYVREFFSGNRFRGFDGELILGDPTAKDVYNQTNSAVMSRDGEPRVDFYVFDMFTLGGYTFEKRLEEVQRRIDRLGVVPLRVHHHKVLNDLEELKAFEEEVLWRGYEGVILRAPGALYKQGRSTAREQGMVKIKRFVDSEAEILEVRELMSNQNEQKRDERGYAKRSNHKANMVPMGTMGTLVCRDIHDGRQVDIGSGYTEALRKSLWRRRGLLPGMIVKYKHFPVGAIDRPRHPVFLGFRSKIDL